MTGVQTCALPICSSKRTWRQARDRHPNIPAIDRDAFAPVVRSLSLADKKWRRVPRDQARPVPRRAGVLAEGAGQNEPRAGPRTDMTNARKELTSCSEGVRIIGVAVEPYIPMNPRRPALRSLHAPVRFGCHNLTAGPPGLIWERN